VKFREKQLKPGGSGCDTRLSILIVNYNGGKMLSDCLASVYATVTTEPMEVIVVDNDSKDGSIDAARDKYPQTKILQNDFNNWFTGGTNQAILESSGEYLLCLNPDTVCHEGAIDDLVAFLDSHPHAGLVAPKLLNGDGSLQPSCRNYLRSRHLILQHILPWKLLPNSWRKRAVFEYWDHDETIRVDWIIGACILVRRKTVEAIGLKDEGYPMFHEETDWCYRMSRDAWDIWFLHTAEITHFGSQSALKYVKKHFGGFPLLLHRGLLAGLLSLRLAGVLIRRIFSSNEDLKRETTFLLKGLAIQLGIGDSRSSKS